MPATGPLATLLQPSYPQLAGGRGGAEVEPGLDGRDGPALTPPLAGSVDVLPVPTPRLSPLGWRLR